MKRVKIKGMSCNHCVMSVTKALSEIEGVEDLSVSLDAGEATFQERAPVDIRLVRQKIREAGYEVVE